MPRLGVSVNDKYLNSTPYGSAGGRRGRAPRDVSALTGVRRVEAAPILPRVLVAALWLALFAAGLVFVSLWRLYQFAH